MTGVSFLTHRAQGRTDLLEGVDRDGEQRHQWQARVLSDSRNHLRNWGTQVQVPSEQLLKLCVLDPFLLYPWPSVKEAWTKRAGLEEGYLHSSEEERRHSSSLPFFPPRMRDLTLP